MSINMVRVAAFEEQLLGWLEQARAGFPILTMPDVKTIKTGMCISCGTPIPTGWRCADCLEVVNCVIGEFAG